MGKLNGIDKIYGEVIRTFIDHEREIAEALYPGIGEFKRGELAPIFLRGYGGTSSTLIKLTNTVSGGRIFSFLVRYYGGKPPTTYQGKIPPWESHAEGYAFLREAGIENVPRSFLPESSAKMLFLEWVDGKILGEKMKGLNEEEQKSLLKQLNKELVSVQYRATRATAGISEQRKKRLFVGRSMEEKAREYFTALTGSITDEHIRAYRLIAKAHEGYCVNHGDLSHTNVIVGENDKICFIDPELSLSDGLNDIGSVFGYLGMSFNLKHLWQEVGADFKQSKLELNVKESGGELKESIPLSPKAMEEVLYKLYASIFHKSFKILAKNQRTHLFEELCETRLKQQMGMILGEFIASPDKFGLQNEDVDAAKVLMSSYDAPKVSKNYHGSECQLEVLVT